MWTKHLAEVGLIRQSGDVDISMTTLTAKKRGRPLMLRENLDENVKY